MENFNGINALVLDLLNCDADNAAKLDNGALAVYYLAYDVFMGEVCDDLEQQLLLS